MSPWCFHKITRRCSGGSFCPLSANRCALIDWSHFEPGVYANFGARFLPDEHLASFTAAHEHDTLEQYFVYCQSMISRPHLEISSPQLVSPSSSLWLAWLCRLSAIILRPRFLQFGSDFIAIYCHWILPIAWFTGDRFDE